MRQQTARHALAFGVLAVLLGLIVYLVFVAWATPPAAQPVEDTSTITTLTPPRPIPIPPAGRLWAPARRPLSMRGKWWGKALKLSYTSHNRWLRPVDRYRPWRYVRRPDGSRIATPGVWRVVARRARWVYSWRLRYWFVADTSNYAPDEGPIGGGPFTTGGNRVHGPGVLHSHYGLRVRHGHGAVDNRRIPAWGYLQRYGWILLDDRFGGGNPPNRIDLGWTTKRDWYRFPWRFARMYRPVRTRQRVWYFTAVWHVPVYQPK